MRIWIDTEFNGWGGELISIGLVAEDGQELYCVLGCKDPEPWVKENVIPHLLSPDVDNPTLQQKLWTFLRKYPSVHIIADWPTDFIHFYNCLLVGDGNMMTVPPLTTELVRGLSCDSELPHNAIADAKALKAAYLRKETK